MMRRIVAIFSAIAIVFSGLVYSPAETKAAPANPGDNVWQQVWSDEFNGNSLDQGAWNYDIGGSDGGGWGNNELQYYTNKGDNVYVSDGTLKLKAKREDYGGCRFTSGRIRTNGKKSFKYGKMEARIRVIGGNQDGVWPAFWMMGDDGQPWPSCGELDIMEHANGRNYVEGTIHWNENGLQSQVGYNHVFWGSYANNRYYWFDNNDSNGITAWHTYGVTWDAECIKWYVDGNVYEEAWLGANNAYAFQKAHYFLLNLALGSNATPYTGNVAPNNWFSEATMEVDYVRAYTYNPNGGSGGSGGNDTPSGYTDGNADNNWHNTGSWNYLVGGDARLAYKNSSSQDSYDVYIKNRGTWDWCTQIRPNDISLENGAKYRYEVTVNSSKAFSPLVMNYEDGQDGYKSTLINQGVNAGNTTFTGEFTADSNKARFKMDLFNADAGTTFKVTKFSITKVGSATQAPTTQAPTQAPTTKKPSVDPNTANYADIENGPGLKYSTGSDATVVNVQNPGWTEGNYNGDGVYFHVPAGIESIKVNNGGGAHIEGAGGLVFLSALRDGINTIDVNYAGGSTTFYIKKEAVATTAAPTTTKENIPDGFTVGKENEKVNLNAWSYYFVTGWTGATGYYKGGNSLNDFAIKIKEQNQTAWGTQISPKVTLEPNTKYNYKFVFNSTSADNIVVNEDIAEGESNTLVNGKLNTGDNTYTGSFTTKNANESIVISLGELANGATFTVKECSITKEVVTTTEQKTDAPTTQAPTTTRAATQAQTTTAAATTKPSGNVDESIDQPVGLTYAGNNDLPFFFAWGASSGVDGYNVFVDGNYIETVTGGNTNLNPELFANGDEHIVVIQAVKGDKVSKAVAVKYNKTNNVTEPVEVNGDFEVVTTSATTTAEATTTVQQTTKPADTTTAQQTTKPADTTTAEQTTKPADTTVEQTTKLADTTTAAEPTTEASDDDIVMDKEIADVDEYKLGGYSVYAGSWNNSTAIAGVDPDDEDIIAIQPKSSNWDKWGLQVKKLITGLEAGKEYKVYVDAYTSKADGNMVCDVTGGDTWIPTVAEDWIEMEGMKAADDNGTLQVTLGLGNVGVGNIVKIYGVYVYDGEDLVYPGDDEDVTTKAADTTAQQTTKPADTTTKQTTTAKETTAEIITKAPEKTEAPKVTQTESKTDAGIKTLGKVKIKKIYKKKKSAKKLKIAIKKLAGVKGYQVAIYKTKKNAKKNKKAIVKKFVKKNVAKLVIKSSKLKIININIHANIDNIEKIPPLTVYNLGIFSL